MPADLAARIARARESLARECPDADPLLPALLDVAEALAAAQGVLWMAREYAEGGGSGGPEMREFEAVEQTVSAALTKLEGVLP